MQIVDLQKNYRTVKALKSVSLNLEGNKIIVLLGVNGAGKTSLMRIIAGLEDSNSGQILFKPSEYRLQDSSKSFNPSFSKNRYVHYECLR